MPEALPQFDAGAPAHSGSPGESTALLAPLNDAFLPALLKLASIQPGERALILQAGPGGLVDAVAQRTGTDGAILLAGDGQPREPIPTSRGAVPIANTNAELRDLQEGYWDVAVCHLGVPSLPDPVATLRELHRLLRPVGRVALSAWGLPDRVRWLGFPLGLLARRGLGFRAPERLPIFSYGAPGSLSHSLAEAGYEDVTPERVREDAAFADFDHYWRLLRFGTRETAAPLAQLSSQDLETVRSELERVVRPYIQRDGRILLPMEALIVAAVK
jgi:SAM-dependent methyltransferase